jgi:GntR family carbon starvation induced transcriptional regulator
MPANSRHWGRTKTGQQDDRPRLQGVLVARARRLSNSRGVPTDIPSVKNFTAPSVIAPVDPKRNPTLAVQYWLGRDIVRGVFAPHERLKVEQLVAFYDVGHSPVREAILLLSTSGLVVHEHQKGHRVAPVSLTDYDDLIRAYRKIYQLMLDSALKHGNEAWEEAVVLQLHRSLKVEKNFDDPEHREMWQRAYSALHWALLSGCGSPILMRIWADLGGRLERYVNLFADLEIDRVLDHHSKHRAIVDAVVKRDADRLHELVADMFEMGVQFHQTISRTLGSYEKTVGSEPAVDGAGGGPRKRGRPRKNPA